MEVHQSPQASSGPVVISTGCESPTRSLHPSKFYMEPKNGDLEDDVPFQLGDFKGSSP